jgi:hypothetical protein
MIRWFDSEDNAGPQEKRLGIESTEWLWQLDATNLILDGLCAVLVALTAGVLCEWRIRRREPGTTNHKPGTAA